MDELMEVSFSPIAATGKPLSRCGKCHRFMKYIQVSGVHVLMCPEGGAHSCHLVTRLSEPPDLWVLGSETSWSSAVALSLQGAGLQRPL